MDSIAVDYAQHPEYTKNLFAFLDGRANDAEHWCPFTGTYSDEDDYFDSSYSSDEYSTDNSSFLCI